MTYKPFVESVYVAHGKNGITAELLAYSVNAHGDKLATFKLTFHRYVAEQFLKHRMFSLNANSSRAMSVPKMNQWIEDNPAVPVFWGAQQKGMSPKEECNNSVDLCYGNSASREELWDYAQEHAIGMAIEYWNAGYHQQIPNRLTHAFQMCTYICTATEFDNFFNLRLHDEAAQDEIKILAGCMKECLDNSEPEHFMFIPYKWHIPYVTRYEIFINSLEDSLILSAARCAIVSYNNHTTDEPLPLEKAKLIYSKLIEDTNPHYTPLEHSARIETREEQASKNWVEECFKYSEAFQPSHMNLLLEKLNYYANLKGWLSNRYCIEKGLSK